MVDKTNVERISSDRASTALKDGNALMVCAYEDNRCKQMLIEGAILKSEFEARVSDMSKDQEIIFYCD
jgi:hypothetical protein